MPKKSHEMTIRDLVSKMSSFSDIAEVIIICRMVFVERMSLGAFIEKDYGQYADKAVLTWSVSDYTLMISLYWG